MHNYMLRRLPINGTKFEILFENSLNLWSHLVYSLRNLARNSAQYSVRTCDRDLIANCKAKQIFNRFNCYLKSRNETAQSKLLKQYEPRRQRQTDRLWNTVSPSFNPSFLIWRRKINKILKAISLCFWTVISNFFFSSSLVPWILQKVTSWDNVERENR